MSDLFTDSNSPVVDSNRIIYTPSTFARSALLHLQEIGVLEAKRPHTSSRSGLSSYLFLTVISGSGVLIYNDKSYRLQKDDCLFIDCNLPYSHTTDDHNLWTLRWCHFYGPTLLSIYDKYKKRGGRPVFTPEDAELINSVWSSLMETASSDDYMRDMKINQHLSVLLTLIMSESWHPEDQVTAKKKQSTHDIKKYIDEHYAEKITLDSLSAQFYINKYYLSKTFKEQFGQSLSAYILSVRISKAKRLLRFSDKPVETIGYECGLGAPHYFSQTFKSVEGVPPSKYREQW